MSVIMLINPRQNVHWKALVAECNKGIQSDPEHFSLYMECMRSRLIPFNGTVIRYEDGENDTQWIKSLEFETEEDLVAFKLTFN